MRMKLLHSHVASTYSFLESLNLKINRLRAHVHVSLVDS